MLLSCTGFLVHARIPNQGASPLLVAGLGRSPGGTGPRPRHHARFPADPDPRLGLRSSTPPCPTPPPTTSQAAGRAIGHYCDSGPVGPPERRQPGTPPARACPLPPWGGSIKSAALYNTPHSSGPTWRSVCQRRSGTAAQQALGQPTPTPPATLATEAPHAAASLHRRRKAAQLKLRPEPAAADISLPPLRPQAACGLHCDAKDGARQRSSSFGQSRQPPTSRYHRSGLRPRAVSAAMPKVRSRSTRTQISLTRSTSLSAPTPLSLKSSQPTGCWTHLTAAHCTQTVQGGATQAPAKAGKRQYLVTATPASGRVQSPLRWHKVRS